MSSHTPSDSNDDIASQNDSIDSSDRPEPPDVFDDSSNKGDSNNSLVDVDHELMLAGGDPYELTLISTTDSNEFTVSISEVNGEWCVTTLLINNSEISLNGCMDVEANEIEINHSKSRIDISLD